MNARKVTLTTLATFYALVGVLVLLSTPALAARGAHTFDSSFGSKGSGSGQLEDPSGVAVNDTTHDVYVVDRGNNRVEEFNSTGTTVLAEFNGSAAPTGMLSSPSAIAVDNSGNPLDPSAGDVYVVDTGHDVIDKFSSSGTYIGHLTEAATGSAFGELDGVAVDPSGVVWVYQGSKEIDSFSDASANEFLSQRQSPFGTSPGFAVDSGDDLYVNRGAEVVAKLDSLGNQLIEEIDGAQTTGVGVDLSSNDVYIDNIETVGLFDTSGALIERFGSGHLIGGSGVAVDDTNGTAYVADSSADDVVIFTAPLLPDVSSEAATNLATEGSATLHGTVNPDGEAVTTCEFEYGAEESYGQAAACVPPPGSGSSPVAVHADISGLQPGSLYHYRLVAGNANGTNPGGDRMFVAPRHPVIDGESVADVTLSSAKLSAQINPGGSDTTYRFEYGPNASYGTSVPIPDGAIGAGLDDVAVSVQLQGLKAHAAYHWRVVASNEVEREVVGPDQAFSTQTTGGPLVLPDDRQWEMVSPAQKSGMQIFPAFDAVMQAAESGGAITYYATGPFVSEASGNVALSQALSKRSSSGWSTQDIAPTRELPVVPNNSGAQSEDEFFSQDLASGLVQPFVGSALATIKTLYLRDNSSGTYEALVTAANVLPETNYGGVNEEGGGIQFVTATPDLSHVILNSNKNLTAQGSTEALLQGGVNNYYEWADGQLQFINVLPADVPQGDRQGEVDIGNAVGRIGNRRNALSADGSRVFWSTSNGELYMRDFAADTAVWINQVQEGLAEPEGNRAEFQLANRDGSKVFFTDQAQLTTVPGGGLYVYDVESGKLTLLTVTKNVGEVAGIDGMLLGSSEDGSYAYFVSSSVLSDGKGPQGEVAEPGLNNLYSIHSELDGVVTKWKTSFITTLSSDDSPDWGSSGQALLTARVSPDGRELAFMSDRSITGYDNLDVTSGQPDEEVYSYDAQSKRLVCASCDPTGARPVGQRNATGYTSSLPDLNGAWYQRWLAASVPEWVAFSGSPIPKTTYQPRYLSNGGRLFFNSSDALVPQDTNGTEDVYEYEPEGVGDCTSSGTTYSEKAGGCVSLLSGGKGEQESVFADASKSGSDAFFVTSERLAGSDVDRAYDMYDAHACSSEVPCLAAEAVVPPPCDTADSCKVALSPQPSIFGLPASATFAGAGNVAQAPGALRAKPKAKPKKKLKKRGKHARKRVRRHLAKHAGKSAGRSHKNASKRGVR